MFEAAKGVLVLAVGFGLFTLVHRDVDTAVYRLTEAATPRSGASCSKHLKVRHGKRKRLCSLQIVRKRFNTPRNPTGGGKKAGSTMPETALPEVRRFLNASVFEIRPAGPKSPK